MQKQNSAGRRAAFVTGASEGIGAAIALGLGAVRWWVTWPRYTALKFTSRIADGRFAEAQMLFASTETLRITNWPRESWTSDPWLLPRSFTDVLAGRQKFKLSHDWHTFTIHRGLIYDTTEYIEF